jgi:hypothetical protein
MPIADLYILPGPNMVNSPASKVAQSCVVKMTSRVEDDLCRWGFVVSVHKVLGVLRVGVSPLARYDLLDSFKV